MTSQEQLSIPTEFWLHICFAFSCGMLNNFQVNPGQAPLQLQYRTYHFVNSQAHEWILQLPRNSQNLLGERFSRALQCFAQA